MMDSGAFLSSHKREAVTGRPNSESKAKETSDSGAVQERKIRGAPYFGASTNCPHMHPGVRIARNWNAAHT
jgi:hypothetical protein